MREKNREKQEKEKDQANRRHHHLERDVPVGCGAKGVVFPVFVTVIRRRAGLEQFAFRLCEFLFAEEPFFAELSQSFEFVG